MHYLAYILRFTSTNLLSGWLLRQWLPLYQAIPLAYTLSLPLVWYLANRWSLNLQIKLKTAWLHLAVAVLEIALLTSGTLGLNLYLTDIALGQADFQLSHIGVIKTISHAVILPIIGSLFYPLYKRIYRKTQLHYNL